MICLAGDALTPSEVRRPEESRSLTSTKRGKRCFRGAISTDLVIEVDMVSSLPLALPGDGRVVGRRLRPDGGRMGGGSGEEMVGPATSTKQGRRGDEKRGEELWPCGARHARSGEGIKKEGERAREGHPR